MTNRENKPQRRARVTIADLEFCRAQGWHIDLQAHVRRGGRVLGVCAGYQMLGKLVDSLPRDQRLVLVRRFIEQRSIREVAGELGRSEGAIKQLQVRALRTLREKLEAKHA